MSGEQVLKENIWNNSYIKVANKMLYYKNWRDKGIFYIKDLLNQHGNIMTRQELIANSDIQLAPLQYKMVLTAIPTKWKI
jgi:hypothetical protein